MQELVNKANLSIQANLILEKEVESYKKELGIIQKHYNQAAFEANALRKDRNSCHDQMKTMQAQIQRLLQVEEFYSTKEGNNQMIEMQHLKQVNQQNTIRIQELLFSVQAFEGQKIQMMKHQQQFQQSQLILLEQLRQQNIAKTQIVDQAKKEKQDLLIKCEKIQGDHEKEVKKHHQQFQVLRNKIQQSEGVIIDKQVKIASFVKEMEILAKTVLQLKREIAEEQQKQKNQGMLYSDKIKKLESNCMYFEEISKGQEKEISFLKGQAQKSNSLIVKLKNDLDKLTKDSMLKESCLVLKNQEVESQMQKMSKNLKEIETLTQTVAGLKKQINEQQQKDKHKDVLYSDKIKKLQCELKGFKERCQDQQKELILLREQNQKSTYLMAKLDDDLKRSKEDNLLKEKSLMLKSKELQDEILKIDQNRFKIDMSTLFETQLLNTKEQEMKQLKKVVSDQSKFISEGNIKIKDLKQLLASKNNQIQSLQETNYLFKRQLTNSLKDAESVRKDLLHLKSSKSKMSLHNSMKLSANGFLNQQKNMIPTSLSQTHTRSSCKQEKSSFYQIAQLHTDRKLRENDKDLTLSQDSIVEIKIEEEI